MPPFVAPKPAPAPIGVRQSGVNALQRGFQDNPLLSFNLESRSPRPFEHGVLTPVNTPPPPVTPQDVPSRAGSLQRQDPQYSVQKMADWMAGRTAGHEAEVAAVIAQMQAANEAQAIAASAGLGNVAAQRQAVLHRQQSGLRDIEQATEAGVEEATANALQRGIYDSGIRQENQVTAIREGAEAESDLRAQTAFQLQALAAQAAQIRATASAIRAQGQVAVTGAQFSMKREFDQAMLNNLLQWGYTPEEADQILGLIPPPRTGNRGVGAGVQPI